ncbi:hypothetical protein FOFC_02891 [Fusarium oxysporum]|nr:hypothetical protein FOFC_02891 [Fusarium oxysporum]
MCYLRPLSTSTFRLREPVTFRALPPRFSPVRPTSAASDAQTTIAASCCLTLRVVAPSPLPSPSPAV